MFRRSIKNSLKVLERRVEQRTKVLETAPQIYAKRERRQKRGQERKSNLLRRFKEFECALVTENRKNPMREKRLIHMTRTFFETFVFSNPEKIQGNANTKTAAPVKTKMDGIRNHNLAFSSMA